MGYHKCLFEDVFFGSDFDYQSYVCGGFKHTIATTYVDDVKPRTSHLYNYDNIYAKKRKKTQRGESHSIDYIQAIVCILNVLVYH